MARMLMEHHADVTVEQLRENTAPFEVSPDLKPMNLS